MHEWCSSCPHLTPPRGLSSSPPHSDSKISPASRFLSVPFYTPTATSVTKTFATSSSSPRESQKDQDDMVFVSSTATSGDTYMTITISLSSLSL